MKEQNEYQIKAKELRKEFLTVSVTECTSKEFEWGHYKNRTVKFGMCRINHVSYVACKDVVYGLIDRKRTLVERGLFDESDFVYFITNLATNKGHTAAFIRADKLYQAREELTKLFVGTYDPQKPIIPVAETAIEMKIQNVDIDYKMFNRSQEAYKKRLELLAKSKETNRLKREQEDMEYEQERERQRIETGKQEERTLRDLVGQIEAMGWKVSLTLKG